VAEVAYFIPTLLQYCCYLYMSYVICRAISVHTQTHTRTYIHTYTHVSARLNQADLEATAYIKDGEKHSCSFGNLRRVRCFVQSGQIACLHNAAHPWWPFHISASATGALLCILHVLLLALLQFGFRLMLIPPPHFAFLHILHSVIERCTPAVS
jgi:ABC-type protease/lipase transport system fused ATPase/permease subunit